MNSLSLSFSLLLILPLALASSIDAQKELTITVYHDDFAMVRDVRTINFDEGRSSLEFNDVAASL